MMGLSRSDGTMLISLARKALEGYVASGNRESVDIDIQGLPRSITEEKGVFVAVYLEGGLRGCMGSVLPVLPLWEACMENARGAAYKDPRFLPLRVQDLDRISLEITIIDTPRPFTELMELEKGTRGLILTNGFRKEVFLPGALKDLPFSMEETFALLRARAEMGGDHEGPELWEVFDAEVVSERHTSREPGPIGS